jgi:hypothetical protein
VQGLLGRVSVTDVLVKLGGSSGGSGSGSGSGEVHPLDYLGHHGSREILSPIAHTLTLLWLHANPHIDADTTQLEQLALHGSGTRAKLARRKTQTREASSRQARKAAAKASEAAALAKSKATAILEKAQAARKKTLEAREARAARATGTGTIPTGTIPTGTELGDDLSTSAQTLRPSAAATAHGDAHGGARGDAHGGALAEMLTDTVMCAERAVSNSSEPGRSAVPSSASPPESADIAYSSRTKSVDVLQRFTRHAASRTSATISRASSSLGSSLGAVAGAAAKLDHVVRAKLRGSGTSNNASAMGVQSHADGAPDETP